jgi:hypothetical protein
MVKASLSSMAKDLAKPEIQKPINTVKTKVTFMIPNNLLVSLERCVMKMKDMNAKKRGKINKSFITEIALKAAIADFNKNGKESQLYRNTETQLSRYTD